jgi:hypothetical protein
MCSLTLWTTLRRREPLAECGREYIAAAWAVRPPAAPRQVTSRGVV